MNSVKDQNLILRHFGLVVKNLRQERKISQEELARRSGLHRTYITDVEHGSRNVSLESISKIANAFGISITDLFFMIERYSASEADAQSISSVMVTEKYDPVDILLIEHAQNHDDVLSHSLRDWRVGNNIYAFKDGQEALEFLFSAADEKLRMERLPKLILLDLNLPNSESVGVLEKIREKKSTRHIPVVVLTPSAEDERLAQCKKFGVKDYLTKPIGFTDLANMLPQLGFQWLLLGKSDL